MKKKVLAVILAVVSVAALAACGSNGAAEPKADGSAATEKSSSTSADTTIKIGAKSFSESKILGELYVSGVHRYFITDDSGSADGDRSTDHL